ncbi:MAG: hypothetical protein JWP97_6571 [Labilithrix sp.]|nr:hypothetical protein [Labilithrix sp.]
MKRAAALGCILVVATTSAIVVACSSDDPAPEIGPQSTAAAVSGAADTHCGDRVVTVDPAACSADGGHEHDEDAGEHDHGEADEHGVTLFGSEGEDDECKYHVSWTSSPVSVNADVRFMVHATHRATSQPVLGANPYTEIFLNDTHPAPNTDVKTVEGGAGNYAIGPVRFDQPGRWTVRFHFAATCADGDESPHGHAAFFVNVP